MRLRLILHVFDGNPTPSLPRVEVWEKNWFGSETNPILLVAEKPGGSYCCLFSQERQEGNLVVYHPHATSSKLPLLGDLPKFGWEKTQL